MEKEKRNSKNNNIKKKVVTGLIAALTFAPSITNTAKANIDCYYPPFYNRSPIHNRIHWSPQVHSLIPGNLKYNPYAFKYGSSGLVPRNFHWNPYAFSYEHSGLVADYHWFYSGFFPDSHNLHGSHHHYHPITVIYHNLPCSSNPSNLSSKAKETPKKIESHRTRIGASKQSRAEINKRKENDGRKIISEYFKNRSIDFKTDQIFSRENKTLSVNFILGDKKTIIKYWNPEEINSLTHQPEYVNALFKNYEKRWEDFCEENNKKEDKWKIHTIKASNKNETLNKLEKIVKTNF